MTAALAWHWFLIISLIGFAAMMTAMAYFTPQGGIRPMPLWVYRSGEVFYLLVLAIGLPVGAWYLLSLLP